MHLPLDEMGAPGGPGPASAASAWLSVMTSASPTPTIAGEIKRCFRDYCWMIRPPRRLQELHSELRSVEPDLLQRLHRTPSAVELALELGVKVSSRLSTRLPVQGPSTRSLSLRGMDISHEVRALHVRTASQVGAGKVSGHRHGQAAVADLDPRRWAL